jgi:hypothetical protein
VHDFHRNQDGIVCQKVNHLVHVFLVFPLKHSDKTVKLFYIEHKFKLHIHVDIQITNKNKYYTFSLNKSRNHTPNSSSESGILLISCRLKQTKILSSEHQIFLPSLNIL